MNKTQVNKVVWLTFSPVIGIVVRCSQEFLQFGKEGNWAFIHNIGTSDNEGSFTKILMFFANQSNLHSWIDREVQ